MADTAPLPAVETGPGPLGSASATRARGAVGGRAASRGLRILEGAAGLLSGGVLVLGVVLLLSQLFAPSLLGGTGYAAATGPGWWRVAAHLAVGLAGETGVLLRGRIPVAARTAVAAITILAAVAILACSWWI